MIEVSIGAVKSQLKSSKPSRSPSMSGIAGVISVKFIVLNNMPRVTPARTYAFVFLGKSYIMARPL